MAIHAANEGELMCGVCKEEFTEKDKLLQHLKIHAGARSVKDAEKNQKCPFCNKMFFTRKDVKRHLVVHTKDRDFLCQYCPQRFGRRDHLVRHLKKAHSNEAAADGIAGVLPGLESRLKESPGKGKAKKATLPPALGPSEESVDRRLEGHSNMVSELLQSVAINMANELPPATKEEKIGNVPDKQQLQKGDQGMTELQQLILQPAQSGATQYVTIPIAGRTKTVPLQLGLSGSQVQELSLSSSGFVPPVLSTNLVQAPAQQGQASAATEPIQQQQVATIMAKLGQNFVQLTTVPSGGQVTGGVALQAGEANTGALVPGIPIPPVSGGVNTVLDLLTSNEDREAAEKLTLLSNAASLPQPQEQSNVVNFSDAVKLTNFGQFPENLSSQAHN